MLNYKWYYNRINLNILFYKFNIIYSYFINCISCKITKIMNKLCIRYLYAIIINKICINCIFI